MSCPSARMCPFMACSSCAWVAPAGRSNLVFGPQESFQVVPAMHAWGGIAMADKLRCDQFIKPPPIPGIDRLDKGRDDGLVPLGQPCPVLTPESYGPSPRL